MPRHRTMPRLRNVIQTHRRPIRNLRRHHPHPTTTPPQRNNPHSQKTRTKPTSNHRNRPMTNNWIERAACKGMTHLFFPSPAERPQRRKRREDEARQICQSCPVKLPCRDFARNHLEYGLWGAENEDERHMAGYHLPAPIGVRALRSKLE